MTDNVIPPITDPLGKYWQQPDLDRILVDDEHAVMDESDFNLLHEYSCSTPTGVYPGKMWKVNKYAYRPGPDGLKEEWYLRWFGLSEPGFCSNHSRKILVLENVHA